MSREHGKNDSNPLHQVMNRRQLLRRLGFGSVVVGSGSLVTLLQGCAVAPDAGGDSFLPAAELANLAQICEGILPRTQTPGAIDAGVPEHLNAALTVVNRRQEADYFRRGMGLFVANAERELGRPLVEADTAGVTAVINASLRRYDVDPSQLEELNATLAQNRTVDDEFLEAYFLSNVVDATLWSYFTSELIGENVLRHDPVPGAYDACIDYRAGEHTWSS